MMASVLSRAAAGPIVSGTLPADLLGGGLCEKDISPSRLD